MPKASIEALWSSLSRFETVQELNNLRETKISGGWKKSTLYNSDSDLSEKYVLSFELKWLRRS